MKNVVIVGGGTAGWLTALFAEKHLPDCRISVIESSQIGVLGAGEGTVPNIIDILEMIDIPPMALIRFCDATTKHAIRFANWNGEGTEYYHVFHNDDDLYHHPSNVTHGYVPIRILESIMHRDHIAESTLQWFMCRDKKNPFIIENDSLEVIDHYALHFDAKMLAEFLRQNAVSRGVEVFDDIIEDVEIEGDRVLKVKSKKKEYECDIVYDCTGFRKTVLSKLNPEWVSYKDHETVNRAIPFIIPHDETVLEPYTESIAMKYGWCWIIPTQSRYGCGYTFDGNLVSDEEIRKEIKENFPDAKIPDKVFEFESGYYKNPWIGNCIAIGLSAGFIEPLEATSIFSSTMSIVESITMPHMLLECNDRYRKEFNRKWAEISEEIHDFVYLHYITNRNDTEFWRKFSIDSAPASLKKDLDKWAEYPIGAADISDRFFNASSWYQVMQGIEMLPDDIYRNLYNGMKFNKEFTQEKYREDKQFKEQLTTQLINNDYIENV